ncbi:MAG: GNAT family N-acetyltransferase [Bdellovibrionales bacterium]|nr:GNAT family N-acetyltransferase [Bdellovibrionales bacterium]
MKLVPQPLERKHQEAFLRFTDANIGARYYTPEDFQKLFDLSCHHQRSLAYVLLDQDSGNIHGVRVTYPPPRWLQQETAPLFTELWNVPPESVAYFKSLFVDAKLQGQGWGPTLSQASLKDLAAMGCQAVVAHSWKESPNNSSLRYLEKIGFKAIGEHPLFWSEIDYDCTRCKKPPCQCTAVEMILYLAPIS